MNLREFVVKSVEEDAPYGDITSRTVKGINTKAVILAGEGGIFGRDGYRRILQSLWY